MEPVLGELLVRRRERGRHGLARPLLRRVDPHGVIAPSSPHRWPVYGNVEPLCVVEIAPDDELREQLTVDLFAVVAAVRHWPSTACPAAFGWSDSWQVWK
jgi:hypothetical protein